MAPDADVAFPALEDLLLEVGDLGLSYPESVATGTVSAVDILEFVLKFAPLRRALFLVLELHDADPGALRDDQAARLERQIPGVMTLVDRLFDDARIKREGLARASFANQLRLQHLGRTRFGPRMGGPNIVEPSTRSPLQFLWFSVAVSADAIIPPYPVPGVYRCAYHLCGDVFLSRKRGVVGRLRFCSIEHGKRFHAAKRMKQKTKAYHHQQQQEE